MTRITARIAIVLLLGFTTAAVAACGGSGDTAVPTIKGPKQTVTVALDWTPNTNHLGAYVAQQKGWYSDAGLNVKFLPYASTAPETLVSTGKANFGFSYAAAVIYARAAGQDVVLVAAPIAKQQYAVGIRADRADIKSPKDLDGKTYAGFGLPDEKPTIDYIVRKDGGKAKYRTVTLNTSAYEAVYSGAADFTLPSKTWEGVEAELKSKQLKYFDYSTYGFPAAYSTALISSNAYLKANPEVARAFLAATMKGYEFAKAHPTEAAKLLVAANPQVLKDPVLVQRSAELLSSGGYYGDGSIDGNRIKAFGDFLYANGGLAAQNGKPLAVNPDWSEFWTNDYLPKN